jgi:glycosyltransferase involved in cell wall biosynthesis
MTSRGENFGMSAVEAQAYGVPTLSYDVMGLRDYNEVVTSLDDMIERILWYRDNFENNREHYMNDRKHLREMTLNKFSNRVVIPEIKEMLTK